MSDQKPNVAIFVLWQSLVVASYRSFFTRLLRFPCRLALAAPHQFTELGNQLLTCTPFTAPFADNTAQARAFVLKAKSWHTQITWFHGLSSALRSFFDAKGEQPRVFLCMSEPYAFTALFAWVVARLTLGKNFYFVCCAMQNIYKPFSLPIRLVQSFVFARCHSVLVLGEEHEEVLRRHGYQGSCWPFPLWFDASRFKAQITPPEMPTIGYAGGLTEAKGLDDLAEALRMLVREHPGKVAVRIAGTGPLLNSMEKLVEELCQHGWDAKCLGPLPAEAMPSFFASLDFLVVPSRTMPNWKEQFGRVIVEAEATGTAVLGSNSGEIPVVVGEPSRIFPERDGAALNKTLARVLTALPTQDRAKYRRTIAEKAFERYSDEKLSERFFRTLMQSLEGGSP